MTASGIAVDAGVRKREGAAPEPSPAPACSRPPARLAVAVRGVIARIPWDAEPAVRTLGLLGCEGGEGVSTLAAALAVEAAVLLVDAHFARPAVHRFFGGRPAPGLAEALTDGVPLSSVVQPTGVPHLSVLPAGKGLDERAADGPGPAGLIETLKDEFTLVVWDLSPVVGLNPATDFTPFLDGLVLVVEAERTPIPAAQRAASDLQARGRVLGTVLNKQPAHGPDWLHHLLAGGDS